MAAMMARRSSSHHLSLSLLAISVVKLIVVEYYGTTCDVICFSRVAELNINNLTSRKWSARIAAIQIIP